MAIGPPRKRRKEAGMSITIRVWRLALTVTLKLKLLNK